MATKTGKKIEIDFAMRDNGQFAFFVRGDATELEGKQALELLMQALDNETLKLEGITEVEKHRDDARIQVVHDLTHLKSRR